MDAIMEKLGRIVLNQHLFAFVLFLVIEKGVCNFVEPKCDVDAEFCEFNFTVRENYTMMIYKGFQDGYPEIMYPVVVDKNGTLKHKRKDCSGLDRISESVQQEINTGDGRYKRIYAVNGKLPGPPIVVYEGQEIVVRLTNRMDSEVTTMHWHGLTQRRTPWMDGVFSVSQCPIQPGQSYTYRFIADQAGTFWYHSHLGTQRSMGIAGPLVILPKPRKNEPWKKDEFDGDFYMMVQDWFEEPSDSIFHRLQYELISYRSFDDQECFLATKSADGVDLGIVPFESALINGKGRIYSDDTGEPIKNVPLETFVVKRGGKYRFRLICASMAYPFRVSIDHHQLHVISSDGNDVNTTPVESVMIQGGERYDFWIEARDPTMEGNYWIRVQTLEYLHFTKKIKPQFTLAILRYEHAPEKEPETRRRLCSELDPCTILNCPFKAYLQEEHNKCIPITNLRHREMKPTLKLSKPEMFTEHFLNFHFSGRNAKNIRAFKPNINGKIHVPYSKPAQIYPESYSGDVCDEEECAAEACFCTHQIDIPLGHVVQMVLFINLPPLELIGITGTAHPIHIHGHRFQVVKIGYPTYNKTTGFFENNSPDILCNDDMCNKATWSDPSWLGGNVPGMLTHGAPLKDSVLVPAGGYVVIRFLADNPGFWYMHCHVEYHNEMGMALVIKEGDVGEMNPAPSSVRECGDFTWSDEEFLQKVNNPSPPVDRSSEAAQIDLVPCGDYLVNVKFTTFILAGTSIMFAVASFSLYCKHVSNARKATAASKDFRRKLRTSKRRDFTQLSGSTSKEEDSPSDRSLSRSGGSQSPGARRKRRAASGGSVSREHSEEEHYEPLLTHYSE